MLPEAEPVAALFLAAQTQWRQGFNGPVGLDYAGVEALARLRGEPLTPAQFALLQVCEQATLEVASARKPAAGEPPAADVRIESYG